jgi:hypothetical protein
MPPGRRKRGRSKVRWMKLIQDAVAKAGMEERQWMGTEDWRFEMLRRQ